jgi:NitT/TauT family transport system ATP-binding protein
VTNQHLAAASGIGPGLGADVAVRFENLGLRFGKNSDWVLQNLDLEIKKGEFFVLVGPSGCGKSTLLRVLAGIAEATEGEARLASGPVTGPGTDRGMVFQSVDAPLMDWLTARQNVEFGLKIQGMNRSERRKVADKYLAKVGLQRAADKFPRELSGGMKQRVQIARILAIRPDIILMDEPFAALDAQSRRLLQAEVSKIWAEERKTFVYITHDIREAVLLGERVAVMSAAPRSGIKSCRTIDLPYPRDEFDARFAELARMVEADIQEEVSKTWED